MKFNKLSQIGMLGGFLLFIATGLRYFVLTQDMDKALYFSIIALLIVAVSYLWALLTDTRKVLDQVEVYLSDLNEENNNGN